MIATSIRDGISVLSIDMPGRWADGFRLHA